MGCSVSQKSPVNDTVKLTPFFGSSPLILRLQTSGRPSDDASNPPKYKIDRCLSWLTAMLTRNRHSLMLPLCSGHEVIAFRSAADTHSDTTTVAKITRKIVVTCGQASMFREDCSFMLRAPAPRRPRMADSRNLMSQRNTVIPRRDGNTCGTTALSMTYIRLARSTKRHRRDRAV